jgi:hypothetical protein
MKKFALLLLLLIVTSCVTTTSTNVTCWRKRICVGNTYVYTHAPNDHGGYYTTDVQIIKVRSNQCLIRHSNGRETWVQCSYFENYVTPKHVYTQPSKKEKEDHDNGNRNRGRGQGKGKGNKY